MINLLTEAVRKGHLHPAYLLVGPPGSGKESTAVAFSNLLLGSEKEFCADRIVVTPEKGSLKIEQVRELLFRVTLKPLESSRLVVIMKEVEKMTPSAANALLKILEEPPPHVHFILITETAELVPPTVRSRCQRISFKQEGTSWQPKPGEEEEWKRCQRELLPFFSESHDFYQVSRKAEEWGVGSDLLSLTQWLRLWWHDLIVYRETEGDHHLYFRERLELIRETARSRSHEKLFSDLERINEAEKALEGNVQKTLALEHLFMGLASQK